MLVFCLAGCMTNTKDLSQDPRYSMLIGQHYRAIYPLTIKGVTMGPLGKNKTTDFYLLDRRHAVEHIAPEDTTHEYLSIGTEIKIIKVVVRNTLDIQVEISGYNNKGAPIYLSYPLKKDAVNNFRTFLEKVSEQEKVIKQKAL